MPSILRQVINLFKRSDDSAASEVWIEPPGELTAKIVGYFDRQTDKAQIRNAIVRRFGTGVLTTKDANGNIRETYVKQGWSEQVDVGLIEVISIGFGHNIVSALATLFTEDSQKFSLVPPSDDVDVTPASDLLGEYRERGDYLGRMTTADKKSVQIGSCGVFPEWVDGGLKYTPIEPGKIKVMYNDAVESDGVTRPVNFTELEDATCVIIETGTVDSAGTEKSYLAVFGRSVEYPRGRYVTYTSTGDGKDVPEIGTEGTRDYVDGGEIANPLSLYADQNPDLSTPEYPLVILYGGHTEGGLFPISLSLLDDALEADLAASHLRSTSADAARGTNVITKEEKAAGKPLPRTMVGNVAVPAGMTFEHHSLDADASMTSWTLLKEEMVSAAQAYGVPDYMVSSEDHTLDASSGIALQVKTRPLIKARQHRERINRAAVHRLFQIEKAFISMFASGEQSAIALLESCDLQWDSGEIKLPVNEKELVETVNLLVDKGVYDTVEAIRVVYQLPSEQEAIAKYEALKVRRKKYPPLNADEQAAQNQPRQSLFRRRGTVTGQDPQQP